MKPRIVVVGSSNTDMVTRAARLPAPGETVLGGHFAMIAGGKGANQAVAAARLGGDVAFIACVGDDSLGRAAIEGFRAEGIDTAHVRLAPEAPSGVASIWVDEAGGENRILVASGANSRLSSADIERARDLIAAAAVLVCQLETPLETVEAALRLAHQSGVTTILNPAPATPLPDGLLGLIDFLTPNETEVRQLTAPLDASEADAAAALLARGVGGVVVTLGAAGAYFSGPEGSGKVDAPKVKKVVDTTGAGDCFTGALAVRLAEGASLAEAVRFAVCAASLSVTRLGAQTSLPYREDIGRVL